MKNKKIASIFGILLLVTIISGCVGKTEDSELGISIEELYKPVELIPIEELYKNPAEHEKFAADSRKYVVIDEKYYFFRGDDIFHIGSSKDSSGPDIAPITMWFSDTHVSEGEQIEVHAIVHNIGHTEVDAFKITFYDRYFAPGVDDPLVYPIGTELVESLASDETIEVLALWDTTKKVGMHQIYAKADSALSISESSERNNVWIEELEVYTNSPKVVVEEPLTDSVYSLGQEITLSGYGDDAQDGWIYDKDALVWSSSGELLGTGHELKISDFTEGRHEILFTVTDSDNNINSEQMVITINPSGYPNAIIESPEEGTYAEGEFMVLNGNGKRVSGEKLSKNAFVWTSSIDGMLGVGMYVTTSDLSVGSHTITLSVTDEDKISKIERRIIIGK